MPPLSIMIKPASSSCNLRCAYCFYADETKRRAVPNYGMMSDATAEAIIRKALSIAQRQCAFSFQGGEPTLAGLAFFERFVAAVNRHNHRNISISYALQTNGTLLDPKWAAFLAAHRFLVGLSLDGTQASHDLYRKDTFGRGSFDRVLRSSRLLDRFHVEYNILTVVTGPLVQNIERIFEFYAQNEFFYQQYIPCMAPLGEAPCNYDYALSAKQYAEFLKRLYDLWYTALESGRYYSIRHFDNIIRMTLGQPPEMCSMRGQCSIQYLFEADGSAFPCDFYAMDTYLLGNINWNSFAELDAARHSIRFVEDSCRVPDKCKACRWYALCRNGCRRDRNDTGDFPGLNNYCEAWREFFEYAVLRMKNIGPLLARCTGAEKA